MSAYARRAIAERQRQHQIKSLLSGNNHTLIQMSSAEFVDYVISIKMKQGMTRVEAVESLDALLAKHNSRPAIWAKHKDKLKTAGGLYPVLDDVAALTVLATEMKRQGNVFGKFKIKVYGNAPAVFINSYPGLQGHLSGTRYLASNPKLFTIGVGKLSANKAIKGGFVVSIVFSVAFHFVEQVLNDNATWHHFVAGIAIDMAVAGAAIVTSQAIITGIGIFTGSVIAGAAITPLLVVVAVGVVFAYSFSDTSQYTNFLVVELTQLEKSLNSGLLSEKNKLIKVSKQYQENPYRVLSRFLGIPQLEFGR
ncbi:hypothetical protein BCU84_10945 [Shewanella sp. 10N.286.51.B7]|uniref:hypothetical protein n=1 Tax=Shewanella sp. 10N.286.51.B7 TaxID=1880836 RepID=UPI000C818B72|nr:hypothetical protein [Shewanella sp. 10N.286.51.B7]PMG77319.1 hypothetical protein BCU84_10945 [Shewanella sp. 10N.286.51.B7]